MHEYDRKHKLKPFLIGKFSVFNWISLVHFLRLGKAANPRCFKHLNVKQLSVPWRSNRSSWMTTTLFDEWLISVNRTKNKEKRNILLFIDHAPCHNADLEYSNVIVKFFPPNTTSRLQRLDQGIKKNFKCFYRKHPLFCMNQTPSFSPSRVTTCQARYQSLCRE